MTRQYGEDGDKEVEPKVFVNVMYACSGKEVWGKFLVIPFKALSAEGPKRLTVW